MNTERGSAALVLTRKQKAIARPFVSFQQGGPSFQVRVRCVRCHSCCHIVRPAASLRSCPLPISPLRLSREEGMIHFFDGSHVKKPESGLFSDWVGNNMDDLRCSDWPKCRHPLVVVDFSLHFCLRNEQ